MQIPRFLGIIQSRFCSKRYPQKALLKLGKYTILEYIAKRLQLIENKHFSFLFAIGEKQHQTITNHLQIRKIPYIIGDEYNVLDRYIKAAKQISTHDYIIRLTADNPFIDINLLEKTMQVIIHQPTDYIHTPTSLFGTGFEFISKQALLKQTNYSLLPHHKEHVTTFISEHPKIFDISPYLYNTTKLSSKEKNIRLTLDVPEDYEVLCNIFYALQQRINISSNEILHLFSTNPNLFKKNQNIIQKDSYSYEHLQR